MEKEYVFFNKIKAFCRQKELFAHGDKVLIGLSGGADSVCLFLLLFDLAKEFSLELVPVHVNHNLRGEEALADQHFCEELCRQHGLSLTVVSVPVAELAAENGWSLEEAGRNARYSAFAEIAKKQQCNKTAVAHHKDDQVETVLFQMFRGSRLKGLSGMEAKNGSLVRPLLSVTREEIEAYLKEKNQDFCIDRTNLEEEYTRNKIRHGILPVAKEVCAGAVEHVAELSDYAGEVEKLLERLTEELFDACARIDANNNVLLEIEALRSAERLLTERVVYKALCVACGRKKDITAGFVADCMALMEKQTGRQITLPDSVVAEKQFDRLFIGRKQENCSSFCLEVKNFPFETILPQTGKKLTLYVKKREEIEENIPKSTYTKWFDYDKIEKVISVRTAAAEDEMVVFTDGRKKKAADVFAEAKIPKELRKQYPVLAEGNRLLWIPGIRGSEGYRVTKETKQVLIATIDGGNEDGR
ncbi:MAG: tRNA lysidine(34) synthetase TilS [Lachnospiraceae bacterium]|nr:tRNA lysidine(34) synthetase TilS [Lachnospiraceae bacterium]